jgi:hypothetical protein
MKTTVTGTFAAEKQAARAVDKLLHACIRGDHVRAFFLGRSGASQRRAGEKRIQSRHVGHEAQNANSSSTAVELEVGPAAGADGIQVSAYTGNLRASGEVEKEGRETPHDTAGILVAVETSDHVSQALAVNVLRQHGASVIERSSGTWQDEQCISFHPVALSSLLEHSALAEGSEDLRGITRH